MKRSRLSYDEWKCIKSKNVKGKQINTDFFEGYIGIVEIEEVSEKQIWKFNGEDIIVDDMDDNVDTFIEYTLRCSEMVG